MKIKRYKKVHRHLNFYVNNYNFRQPYQLLIDGTFCYAALNNQVNIADNIPRYLQGELKLLTTQCAIIEMEKLGAKLNGALLVLKQFPLHRCGHEGKPVTGAECVLSMIGAANDGHYVVATQDRDLQKKLREIPGVPLLYLHAKTPVLDPPSPASVQTAEGRLSQLGESERRQVEELKRLSGMAGDEEAKVPRKRKVKGPNPLSCKKKKRKAEDGQSKKEDSRENVGKKRRKKIRLPKHVKEALLYDTSD